MKTDVGLQSRQGMDLPLEGKQSRPQVLVVWNAKCLENVFITPRKHDQSYCKYIPSSSISGFSGTIIEHLRISTGWPKVCKVVKCILPVLDSQSDLVDSAELV